MMQDVEVIYDRDRSVVRLRPFVWRVTRPRRVWPWLIVAAFLFNALMRLIQGF
jgi:hypothetical protein